MVVRGGRFVKFGFEFGEREKVGRTSVLSVGEMACDRDCGGFGLGGDSEPSALGADTSVI